MRGYQGSGEAGAEGVGRVWMGEGRMWDPLGTKSVKGDRDGREGPPKCEESNKGGKKRRG